jgi:sulfopropanediol 3-dehydrogenase
VPEYLKEPKPVSEQVTEAVRRTVDEILRAVEKEGLEGVRRYSEKLDDWNPESFRVSQEEIDRAEAELDDELKGHIGFALDQIRNFAELQRQSISEFEAETLPGVWLGQKLIPINSVGSYSPGGKYPLLASSIMTCVVPKVAGVPRVVAAAPPRRGTGGIHPPQLYAMAVSGADEILCLGGVQAIGALAYGFEGLPPVDFIVGAGNAFVAEAKRQIFGVAGIDLLAGPTETLIIADESADPDLVALDLLGQAEHGLNSPCWLVTTSRDLGEAVLQAIDRWLEHYPTREMAEASWNDLGGVILVADDGEAVRVADEYAPEHLEVQTKDPDWFLERLTNYGSLFLTPHTTVAYGDKAIGTNHVLPTGRAARYTGGLWVGKFLKTVTYQRATEDGSRSVAPSVAAICEAEMMLGHGLTAKYRLDPEATRRELGVEQAARA